MAAFECKSHKDRGSSSKYIIPLKGMKTHHSSKEKEAVIIAAIESEIGSYCLEMVELVGSKGHGS